MLQIFPFLISLVNLVKNWQEVYLNKWTQIFNLNEEISDAETVKMTKLLYKCVRWLLVNFLELFY